MSEGMPATMTPPRRLIVAITGASGVVHGVRLLERLAAAGIERHLVISKAGVQTIAHELDATVAEVRALADVVHSNDDIAAPIASGSFPTMGMVVAPCSARSLAAIATGVGDNLISRAADVSLKERRPLVLMLRETPLHLGHVRNMARATEMGAILAPPQSAFYIRPSDIEELVDYSVDRVLDLLCIDPGPKVRWGIDLPRETKG